jgi:hypothetical protein
MPRRKASETMIVVHHLNNSRSQRILWLLQMSFPVEAARARGGLDQSRPGLMRFLERIHARPAYRRALATGGPYAFEKLGTSPRR